MQTATQNPTATPWMFGNPDMEKMMQDALAQMESVIKFQELVSQASWKRKTIAGVAVLGNIVGGGYLAGTLIGYMGMGAMTLGASAFMTMAIYLIGTLVAAITLMRTSKAVMMYVLSGKLDDHVSKAWTLIKRPFNRKVLQ